MSIGSLVRSILSSESAHYTPVSAEPPRVQKARPVEPSPSVQILDIEEAALNTPLTQSNNYTVEELVLSYLNFTEEHHPAHFTAEPQEATVNGLCQRTGRACARHLENVVALRQKFDTSLHIAPRGNADVFLSPYGGLPSYQFTDVCLTVKMAVGACDAPSVLKISGMNWTDEEFSLFFTKYRDKLAHVKSLSISFCSNLHHLTVELPELERLQLFGQFKSVVTQNCMKLAKIEVYQNETSYDIDARGSICRQVRSFGPSVNFMSENGQQNQARAFADPFTRPLKRVREEQKEQANA